MRPAIFLDRDGVIVENRPNYVRTWADVALYPQAVTALTRVSATPYVIIIVTNQSAIGRGIITLSEAEKINARLVETLYQAGARIDGVYMCPHAPQDACGCRKPQPGLLLRAAYDHDLNLSASILIGDALTDLAAGHNAGLARLALVRTGRGADQLLTPAAPAWGATPVFADLAQALDQLCPVTNPEKECADGGAHARWG